MTKPLNVHDMDLTKVQDVLEDFCEANGMTLHHAEELLEAIQERLELLAEWN